MSWRKYQNELIVVGAFVIMLGTYAYKHNQATKQAQQAQGTKATLNEMKEVIALKKIWADKKTTKKVLQLKSLIPESKTKWVKKGKKLTVDYTGLSSNELNNLTKTILNMPVEISLLNIKKRASNYNVEFKCKW